VTTPTPTPTPTPALACTGLTKRYGALTANDAVDFELLPGEIHVLLGENGAGKSTLMNMLYGMSAPDAGEIRREGWPVTLRTPTDAIALGIGMVHQHFMLVPVFTVAENVMLGAEVTRAGGVLEHRKVAEELRALSSRYGLEIDPDARVDTLSVGQQQRVEIVKALYRKARVLILDEPTAVLTPQEADALFGVMRDLRAEGVSIVFITHKLREVLAVADRITVMRGGRIVGATTPAETEEAGLAALMVGRDVSLRVEKRAAAPGADVLVLENVCVADHRGLEVVRDVSLRVRAGEILGIAGVQGNGQTELVEVITGLRRAVRGHMTLLGEDVTRATPGRLLDAGLAHVPEDRHRHALIMGWSIADNLVLGRHDRAPYARFGLRRFAAVAENARRLFTAFDIRGAGPDATCQSLSGGNQQKVVLARALSGEVRLLVANQPTRGVDVGAIEQLHREIVAARDAGAAVLLVSAELDEIMGLADRIVVMYRGQVVSEVDAAAATRPTLGLAMAGGVAAEGV
jgi:ABC-type uncharacterized transport system ATPase subunit